ncbi:FAD/NAD(P)-binding protein [Pseudonocardia hydrocarbonoxydans]|uniref:Adenylate cyclase n=1 Tax=Pseudonocardia hydrocarbonoxydans TaxID=76726 RepID=A0A4Y3WKJ6_9PSEU|nr:FAD/NAD(P)-binding protein [Pseudonocardia hydrocarbonoxydans]GEC19487.1 adenylate cyclase [Pseudonocardia hydrocarbonoxydans]
MTPHVATSSIAIVGAGPRGAGLLERLAASAPELVGSDLPAGGLDVHLIDPYPAGAGRIWRHEQSPLLAMNSMAADVTMFTDDSVVCDGPIRPGPSMWDWVRSGPEVDPELAEELAGVTASTFPSRRLQSAYLGWVLQHVIDGLPAGMRAHVHRTRATGLTEDPGPDGGATQVVHLEGAPPLRVDAVVLASGHLDATPTADEVALAGRAAAAGLRYLPPEQTTDSDLSVLAPGETVLVRGMGLAFVDLVVLLFEGRGGRFTDAGYVPSGREPRLVVGSPRGSTYHSKTHYALQAPRPPLPRFFGPAAVDPLIAAGEVDLRAQAWPLMAKEIAWGWYHELFLGHPDAVAQPWAEFAASYAALDWDSPGMRALIEAAVPDPVDRIDFAALDRPLDGLTAPDLAALQPLVRERIAEDLRQHVDVRHSAHLGAFVAMLSVYGETTRLADALSTRSRASDMGWWQGFFNSVASGPPGFRVRQLLALSRAGYIDFLGAGMWVEVEDGAFVAGSATLAGAEPVRAGALVDARLPDPSAARTTDPLLADLVRRGDAAEDILIDDDGTVLRNTGLVRVRPEDGALLDADGAVHPRRFAVGPHTTVKVAGAFTRPGMNAQSLRYNDAIARAVLRSLPAARSATRAA